MQKRIAERQIEKNAHWMVRAGSLRNWNVGPFCDTLPLLEGVIVTVLAPDFPSARTSVCACVQVLVTCFLSTVACLLSD